MKLYRLNAALQKEATRIADALTLEEIMSDIDSLNRQNHGLNPDAAQLEMLRSNIAGNAGWAAPSEILEELRAKEYVGTPLEMIDRIIETARQRPSQGPGYALVERISLQLAEFLRAEVAKELSQKKRLKRPANDAPHKRIR